MNLLLGATLGMAVVLAGALLGGPSDTRAAHLNATTLQDAQDQARRDAQQARIDATLAHGKGDLARLDAAMQQPRPEGVSPSDWAMAQRAVGIATGRE